MQSRIWNKVNYGIRVKKGIPSMVGKKNDKTGIWFDKKITDNKTLIEELKKREYELKK